MKDNEVYYEALRTINKGQACLNELKFIKTLSAPNEHHKAMVKWNEKWAKRFLNNERFGC